MGVVGRISRAAQALRRPLEATFRRFGLNGGEFDVLATLRRSGAPYTLTPTALFTELMLSSGAMTNRLDRLEQAGLIQRRPDPADRRGTLVVLTPVGLTLIDAAVAEHVANERRLLTPLTADEQVQLAGLLRKLLPALEDAPGDEQAS